MTRRLLVSPHHGGASLVARPKMRGKIHRLSQLQSYPTANWLMTPLRGVVGETKKVPLRTCAGCIDWCVGWEDFPKTRRFDGSVSLYSGWSRFDKARLFLFFSMLAFPGGRCNQVPGMYYECERIWRLNLPINIAGVPRAPAKIWVLNVHVWRWSVKAVIPYVR